MPDVAGSPWRMGCRSLSDLDETPRRGWPTVLHPKLLPAAGGTAGHPREQFPVAAPRPNHSIRQRSARHKPTPGVAGRPRSSSPGVFKNLSSSYEHESAPDLVRRIRQSARHQERAGRLLGGTHVAHRSQCVELRHVGSRRRQSAAAARRQAVDDGSTAIPTWMRSAPPQALRAPCS